MNAYLNGTGDGGSSSSTLISHQQLQLQLQQYYHYLVENSVIMNSRYYNNFSHGQQFPLYANHSLTQQESWLQQQQQQKQQQHQQQSVQTVIIQANNNNEYGIIDPNVARLTSNQGLHHDSAFNTNESISISNRLFDAHSRSPAAYAENFVAFQFNQQQHHQPHYFQGIDLSQYDLVDPREVPHTKKTNILDHYPFNNDVLECNIGNQAYQNTSINKTQAYNTFSQTSITGKSRAQIDQGCLYDPSVLYSTRREHQNYMGDLTFAPMDSHQNSTPSTPSWIADENSHLGKTPSHSRNVTGETSSSNMHYNRPSSKQIDTTEPSNAMNHVQDNVPDTGILSSQSLVSPNNQTSDQSIVSPLSKSSTRPDRKRKKTEVSCEPDDIPRWKCVYPGCHKMYGRREDLFNKHIFTYHFENKVKYTCWIGNHKEPSQLTSQKCVAEKHFEKCWDKFKHVHSDKYGTRKDPPEELCSIDDHPITGYSCGVEGCQEATSNKKELQNHYWSEHYNHKTDTLPVHTCPHCRTGIKRRRSEDITKHISMCAKSKRSRRT